MLGMELAFIDKITEFNGEKYVIEQNKENEGI